MHRLAPLALVALCMPVRAEGTSGRDEFIAHGAASVVAGCDLPHRTCYGRRLSLRAVHLGDSNDERRQVELLTQPGLSIEVIFVVEHRQRHYLGMVEVRDRRWGPVAGIRVGTPRATVLRSLGSPDHWPTPDCAGYVHADTVEAVVCFKSARVSSLRWQYFVD